MKTTIILMALAITSIPGTQPDDWGNFRGDAQLTGVSRSRVPRSPEMLWSFNAGSGIKAAPVASGGVIVVGTTEGALLGINDDGSLKWKFMSENAFEAPALIVGNTVYAGNLDGELMAVDLHTGSVRWSYETEGQIMGSPAYYSTGDKEVLLVGSYDFYLHAVDPATGKVLWKYETDNYINGSCAIYEGKAIFGGCDGFVHGVDVLTGKKAFSVDLGTYVASSGCVDGHMVYLGDYDGRFSGVDLAAGKRSWVFENEEANLPFIGAPSVSGSSLYIGNRDKFLYCLNKKDGSVVWKYNTGSRVDASPVALTGGGAGTRVLAANMRGDLNLLDGKTGAVLWSWELATPVHANPAVLGERFYVAGDDGRLYCFGAK